MSNIGDEVNKFLRNECAVKSWKATMWCGRQKKCTRSLFRDFSSSLSSSAPSPSSMLVSSPTGLMRSPLEPLQAGQDIVVRTATECVTTVDKTRRNDRARSTVLGPIMNCWDVAWDAAKFWKEEPKGAHSPRGWAWGWLRGFAALTAHESKSPKMAIHDTEGPEVDDTILPAKTSPPPLAIKLYASSLHCCPFANPLSMS